jgi:cytochrome c peroxidase
MPSDMARRRQARSARRLLLISRTAPYMHDGSLATLNDVSEYYSGGGVKNPALDSKVRALKLSPTEKADLAAFLTSLTGQIQEGR